MRQKYSLIRYMYTEYSNIAEEGGVFFKPIYFEEEFHDMDSQPNILYDFMIGSALKASVNSNQLNTNYTNFWMPKGTWCDIYHPKDRCFSEDKSGSHYNWSSKAYDSYLHLRQGYIMPF